LAAKASYTLLISKLVSGKCFKSVELFRLINGVKKPSIHSTQPPSVASRDLFDDLFINNLHHASVNELSSK